jgi:nucleotide-binding universal stress UspA family protein
MKMIISPTDFSPVSLNAVNYAADMACLLGANLSLIHVYPIPTPVGEVPVVAFSIEQLEADARRQINSLKNELLRRTSQRISIFTEVRAGDVISELIDYCSKLHPFAVIMGAETAAGFERILLGGTSVEALKKILWPLIIVPPLALFTNIRKIGLACDLKEVVESVRVPEIKALLREFDAQLHIIHVSDEESDGFSPRAIEESALLQEMIGQMKPQYHFIKNSEIENGIVRFAEENKIDLLIVVPKRHTLAAKILHPSHSRRLMLQASIPVMSIHE